MKAVYDALVQMIDTLCRIAVALENRNAVLERLEKLLTSALDEG